MKHLTNLSIIAALAVAVAAPTSALAFRAMNNLKVNPEGQFSFEVIQSGGISAADVWCAAGDYAQRVLKVAQTQQVYLIEGKHMARTETRERFGYSFSLTPPKEAANFTSKPLTLSLKNIGDSLSVSFARQYCYNGLDDRMRIFP